MTTRYRLMEPMLVVENEGRTIDVHVPKLVSAADLVKIEASHPGGYGVPIYYAIFPEPDPACYLPLVEPKKKET